MQTTPDVLAALGTPRRRSPIVDPAYRLGQRPANYGLTFPAEVLTPDEIMRLIAACARRGPSGLRNRALIVLLWRCGLRIGEALALAPKDVDPDRGAVTVLHGKGNKRRTVGVDPTALAIVQRWLECRAALGVPRSAPLFCTIAHDELGPPGRPLRSAYVRMMLKRLRDRAGIEKRVHPHGFRHTHAFELAMEGVPMHVIQRQLGHSNLATTARYLDHLAPAQVIEATRGRAWDSAAA
jgi:integrase/recombinase XerD